MANLPFLHIFVHFNVLYGSQYKTFAFLGVGVIKTDLLRITGKGQYAQKGGGRGDGNQREKNYALFSKIT